MNIESIRTTLGILLVAANMAVWWGVWLEKDTHDEGTKKKGFRVLVCGLAVETALSALLLCADTLLSMRQNEDIVETQRIQGAVIEQLKPRDFSKEQYTGFVISLNETIKPPRLLTVFTASTDEASDFSGAVKVALTNASVNWTSAGFNQPGIPASALSKDLPATGLQWYVSPDDPDNAKLSAAFAKACGFVPRGNCSWNPAEKIANIPSPALFVLPRQSAFPPTHSWEFPSFKRPWDSR